MERTRVSERKAVGGAAERQEAAVGVYGADKALEELADVLLDP
jgi:hypothetical protein